MEDLYIITFPFLTITSPDHVVLTGTRAYGSGVLKVKFEGPVSATCLTTVEIEGSVVEGRLGDVQLAQDYTPSSLVSSIEEVLRVVGFEGTPIEPKIRNLSAKASQSHKTIYDFSCRLHEAGNQLIIPNPSFYSYSTRYLIKDFLD